MLKIKRNKKGFTLIELLVVIAIIGLLATIVLVSLNNARNKANDARIKSDLSQIMMGIEMYYADNSAYPGEGTCGTDGVISETGSGIVCGSDGSGNYSLRETVDGSVVPYIQRLPSNPRGSSYDYGWSATNNYTLTATLSDGSTTYTCSNGACY